MRFAAWHALAVLAGALVARAEDAPEVMQGAEAATPVPAAEHADAGGAAGEAGAQAGAGEAPVTKPPTAPPTNKPTVDSLLVSASEVFIDFFVDPFVEGGAGPVFPPVVIAEAGKVNKRWASSGVHVPKHLHFLAFELWHGKASDVKPYFDQDIKVKASPVDTDVVSLVKLELRQGQTTEVQAEFVCTTRGQTKVKFEVMREGAGVVEFNVMKECAVGHLEELLISTRTGDVAFQEGEVQPAFDVHDLRDESYIASKEQQSTAFYFHTIHREYAIAERPVVEAFEPTPELLEIIAKRSRPLAAVVKDFKALSSEEITDETFYLENNDEEADSTDSAGDDPYDNKVDHSEDETASKADESEASSTAAAAAVQTKIDTEPKSQSAASVSAVCKPTLSGEVWHRGKHGSRVSIQHRKDLGEQKLKGFAQAGVLGMHGGRRLSLSYNCVRDGLAIVVLNIRVRPMNGPGKIQDLRLSWLKVCSAGQIAPNEIDLMGVDVHLGMYARDEPSFFPVINGITTDPFSWDGIGLTAAPEEVSTSFYVSLSASVEEERQKQNNPQLIRIRRVRVAARDNARNPSLHPKLSGHGAHGGVLSSESLPITVHYNCRHTGTVKLGIDLLLDVVTQEPNGELVTVGTGKVRRLSFYWRKDCSITPVSQLFVQTVDPAGFNVTEGAATKELKGVPVVREGKVSEKFATSKTTSSKSANHLYHVPKDQRTLALEVYKTVVHRNSESSSVHMGLLLGQPILSSTSTNVQVTLRDVGKMEQIFSVGADDYAEEEAAESAESDSADADASSASGLFIEKQGLLEVVRGDPVFLLVDHVCHNAGSAVITVQLPVYGQDEMVSMSWVKECKWADSRLTPKETGAAVAFFVLVAVLVTSAVLCIFIRRQRVRIRWLESKDKEGFEKMDVVSTA